MEICDLPVDWLFFDSQEEDGMETGSVDLMEFAAHFSDATECTDCGPSRLMYLLFRRDTTWGVAACPQKWTIYDLLTLTSHRLFRRDAGS
jgi:hypothetical protein